MPRFKLGKLPARPDAITFKLSNYLRFRDLPKPPPAFGEFGLVKRWGMLGNDDYGDCVWAGAAHETMLWCRSGHHRCPIFNNPSVLADYAAVTGFNPDDPGTDNGTDMQEAASYRRKIGIRDAAGKRHKIAAYLSINPKSVDHHLVAAHLFGGVGIGFLFPESAWEQFDADEPWDVVAGSPDPDEGHYVPLVGRRDNGNLVVISWGQIVEMTPAFLQRYNDESVCYLSPEMLTRRGLSPEGFDIAQLKSDLSALR